MTTESDGKRYRTKAYNLDVVISVGYRVKSHRGVEFRRWATGVLRRHLIEGHTENAARLEQLGRAVQVMARIPDDLSSRQVLEVVRCYAGAFSALDAYVRGELTRPERTPGLYVLDARKYRAIIHKLALSQEMAGTLFGRERTEGGLEAAVAAVYQGFGGVDAYPSVEEKAFTCSISCLGGRGAPPCQSWAARMSRLSQRQYQFAENSRKRPHLEWMRPR